MGTAHPAGNGLLRPVDYWPVPDRCVGTQ
jgi:hypothetical protein